MKAVSTHGFALQFVSSRELRQDREIVMKAVSQNRQNSFALRHANLELRGSQEIVMKAVSQKFKTVLLSSHSGPPGATLELKKDREIVMQAIS